MTNDTEANAPAGGSCLHAEVRDRVAWVTLNRREALNTLSIGMLEELDVLFAALHADADVRAVVITGAGRAFCAGADLSGLNVGESSSALSAFLATVEQTFSRLRSFPKPIVAAVNGIAAGGGLELALCADFIVAVAGASISDGHSNVGAIPGGGASAMLPRILGPLQAKYLMLTGDSMKAEELVPLGLVARVFPAAEFEASVHALATRLARNSPAGLAAVKRLVASGLEQPSLAVAIAEEARENARHAEGADFAEGVRAFLGRRKPQFENLKPEICS